MRPLALLFLLLSACVQQRTQPPEATPPGPEGADRAPPSISGTLQFSSVRHTTLRVSWPRASDDRSPREELEYKLVRADRAEDIDSLTKIDAVSGEALLFDWQPDVRLFTVRGLSDSRRYAFAVAVRDHAGNQALYAPQTVLTADGSAPTPGGPLVFSDIAAAALTVSWPPGQDGTTAAADLQYKVVFSPSEAALSSVDIAEALPLSQVALDYTKDARTARVRGLSDVLRTHVGVLVRDSFGYRSLYAPGLALSLTKDRVADYPLDGDATDLSGARPRGTVLGAVPTTDRKSQPGMALLFDGTSSVHLGPGSLSGLAGSATFSLWVKPTVAPILGAYYDLFVKARVFTVALYGDGAKTLVAFNNGDGVQWGTQVRSTGEVPAGSYSHVVVTFQAGVVTFYINGVPAGSGSAMLPSLSAQNTCPMTLGFKQETSDPACTLLNAENYFPGALDDLRVFSRALSQTEISALYHERGY